MVRMDRKRLSFVLGAGRALWLIPGVGFPLLFAIPLLTGRFLVQRDLFYFFVPEQVFAAAARAQWRVPFWDPGRYSGTSFLAEPGTGFFYPFNLVFHLFTPWVAATVFDLAHLPVAALGVWLLTRRLDMSPLARTLAVSAYTASGYLLSMQGGAYYFAGAALLPLTAAGLDAAACGSRIRGLVLGALPVTLMVFNGEFQSLLFAAALGAALGLARQARLRERVAGLGRQLLAFCLGLGLGAPQFLPTLLFARSSMRSHGFELSHAALWSLPPLRWVEFLIPMPFGMPFPVSAWWGPPTQFDALMPWATSLYLGPILVLPLLATRWWRQPALAVLGAASALSLLLAAGQRLPVFALFFKLVPFVDRFRYPEKYAAVASLGLCVVGAWAAERLARSTRRALALFGAAGALLGLLALWSGAHPPFLLAVIADGLRRDGASISADVACGDLSLALGHAAWVCLAAAAAAWLARRGRLAALPAFAVVASVSLLLHGARLLDYEDVPEVRTEPPYVAAWRALPAEGTQRLFNDDSCAELTGKGGRQSQDRWCAWDWATGGGNLPTLFGLREAFAYGATETRRQYTLLRFVHETSPELALARIGAAGRLTCESGAVAVVPIDKAYPRVRLVRGRSVSAEEVGLVLRDPSWDFRSEGLVVGPGVPSPGTGVASVSLDEPERVVVDVRGEGGLLVLADAWAPGWSATIDGAATPVRIADAMFRAVEVPAGSHVVEFRYVAPGFAAGVAIAGAALAALALLAAWAKWPRPRRQASGAALAG